MPYVVAIYEQRDKENLGELSSMLGVVVANQEWEAQAEAQKVLGLIREASGEPVTNGSHSRYWKMSLPVFDSYMNFKEIL
jgi:hypothetical protein